MNNRFPRFQHFLLSLLIGFLTGVVLVQFYGIHLPPSPVKKKNAFLNQSAVKPKPDPVPLQRHSSKRSPEIESGRTDSEEVDPTESASILELRSKHLLFPLKDHSIQGVRDTFYEPRGGHIHEAIDIIAARNTPVVAVEDGTIARLWYSRYGGNTIYHFDPSRNYAYYYAHLERYAEDLQEGDHIVQGQVIGYVGTSGNAPPKTPHLHFTIFLLTKEKSWWRGTAINPYLVYNHPS